MAFKFFKRIKKSLPYNIDEVFKMIGIGCDDKNCYNTDNSTVWRVLNAMHQVISIYDLTLHKTNGEEEKDKPVSTGKEFMLWKEILQFSNKGYIQTLRQFNLEWLKSYYNFGLAPIIAIYKNQEFQSITVANSVKYHIEQDYFDFKIFGYEGYTLQARNVNGRYESKGMLYGDLIDIYFYPLLGNIRNQCYTSILYSCSESILGLNNVEKYLEYSFKNKARPSLLLTAQAPVNAEIRPDEQAITQATLEKKAKEMMGLKNTGSVLTITGKDNINAQILQEQLQEAQILPIKESYEKDIILAMGADVDYFFSGSTFNNKAEGRLSFNKSVTTFYRTFLEEFTLVIQDIFEEVGIQNAKDYFVDISESDNETLAMKRVDITLKLLQAKVKTINEVRGELDLPPITGIDSQNDF